MYLVIDDLSIQLVENPIHIPIPMDLLMTKDDRLLKKFTLEVLKDLMKLPYFTWTHSVDDVVIDGFTVRHSRVYPSFST
jgi:hypothetical protein